MYVGEGDLWVCTVLHLTDYLIQLIHVMPIWKAFKAKSNVSSKGLSYQRETKYINKNRVNLYKKNNY